MITMPVSPEPNINGSSLRLLMRKRQQAFEALQTALEAIEAIEPHPRDFLTPGRYEEAVGQHAVRWAKTVGVRDAVLAEYQALLQIFNERKASGQGILT